MQLVGSQFPDQRLNPRWIPNHWTIREFPPKTSLLITCNMYYCYFRTNRVFFFLFLSSNMSNKIKMGRYSTPKKKGLWELQ